MTRESGLLKAIPKKNNACEEGGTRLLKLSTLSPFRYPGGKSWLAGTVEDWLDSSDIKPMVFVEAFAGGANIGLSVLAKGLCSQLVLVEKDESVCAVWETILNDADSLVQKISRFKPLQSELDKVLKSRTRSRLGLAFQTLLRNRVSRSGNISPTGGILKRGENDQGVFSRWYPETLIERIRFVNSLRSKIVFVSGDGLRMISKHSRKNNTFFFIDPPYSGIGKGAGRRLYKHSTIDHDQLFKVTSAIAGRFLMTYEDAAEVRALAKRYSFDVASVAMRTSHHQSVTELLISN